MDIKIRDVLPALVFCLALVLGAAPALAQEDPMAAMAECPLCSQMFDEMELVQACDYSICDTSDGIVCQIVLKDSTMIGRLRDYVKNDVALCKKYRAKSKEERTAAKLCPDGCALYFDFLEAGLKEERIETPTGALHIMRTSDPKLLARVHAWSAKMREMMSSSDLAEAAPAGMESCCGSCSGTGGDAAKATTCGGACGDAAKATTCSGTCADMAEKTEACCGSCTGDADPLAQIPDFMLAEMKKCHLCQVYLENPDMMNAAKSYITFLEHGIVFTTTVHDPKNIGRYHKFEKDFHVRIDKLMENPSYDEVKKMVCGICGQFTDLGHAGAIMDWNVTPTGSVSVFTSHDPKIVAKILAMGRMIDGMMKMNPANQ
jgi:hypothetical protein